MVEEHWRPRLKFVFYTEDKNQVEAIEFVIIYSDYADEVNRVSTQGNT